jgi:hypothetical protein
MRFSLSAFTYFFLFFLLLFSCKKESDEYGPVVSIYSPFENQSFSVYDTILVNASVSDETNITALSVSLVDINYIPVHKSVAAEVSYPPMTLNILYPLDNIHLLSGKYYIMITASDGTNDSRTFCPVMISAVPKQLKKVFVASNTSPYQTNLSYIDSTFSSITPFKNFSGDFTGTSASSYDQRVFLCGNYNGAFSGINIDGSVKFSLSAITSSAPYFTGFYGEDKKNFVARHDDETVKGYDNSGQVIYTAHANPGYYVRKLIMNNGFLVAEEKSKTSSSRILVSFYSTGTAEQQVALNQDVVDLCEKDDHNVFVFGNNSGQGVIQLYDRLNNNLWEPYPYPLATGAILSAVKINETTYLIGHSNGTIYKYQYSGGVTTYLTGFTAKRLRYDELNDQVYIVESNLITAVDFVSKIPVHVISSGENVLDISFLYNR